MEWKCLQVRARAWRVGIVGTDWKTWRRSSLGRSLIFMVDAVRQWMNVELFGSCFFSMLN